VLADLAFGDPHDPPPNRFAARYPNNPPNRGGTAEGGSATGRLLGEGDGCAAEGAGGRKKQAKERHPSCAKPPFALGLRGKDRKLSLRQRSGKGGDRSAAQGRVWRSGSAGGPACRLAADRGQWGQGISGCHLSLHDRRQDGDL